MKLKIPGPPDYNNGIINLQYKITIILFSPIQNTVTVIIIMCW